MSEHSRQRTITTTLGVILLLLAMTPQIPDIWWAIENGASHGFRSGKSSNTIVRSVLCVAMDLTALALFLVYQPRKLRWAFVAPAALFVTWIALIPISLILSGLLHGILS